MTDRQTIRQTDWRTDWQTDRVQTYSPLRFHRWGTNKHGILKPRYKDFMIYECHRNKPSLWNINVPMATKSKMALSLSVKFRFKDIISLTLVSIESVWLVEHARQVWSLYLLQFKSMAKVKVFPQSHIQSYRQANKSCHKTMKFPGGNQISVATINKYMWKVRLWRTEQKKVWFRNS